MFRRSINDFRRLIFNLMIRAKGHAPSDSPMHIDDLVVSEILGIYERLGLDPSEIVNVNPNTTQCDARNVTHPWVELVLHEEKSR